MSSTGVLFAAEGPVAVGDPVEYMITLPTGAEAGSVRLRCLGKIVRLGDADAAATLERYEFVRNGTTPI